MKRVCTGIAALAFSLALLGAGLLALGFAARRHGARRPALREARA